MPTLIEWRLPKSGGGRVHAFAAPEAPWAAVWRGWPACGGKARAGELAADKTFRCRSCERVVRSIGEE